MVYEDVGGSKPPPKPPEVKEEKKKEDSSSKLTPEQKAIFYPVDTPNPPSEPE
jgi:hypothetical protein